MYATLYDFLRMSPTDQAKVTHLDLSIADERDFYRAQSASSFNELGVGHSRRDEAEEYPGEARGTYPETNS